MMTLTKDLEREFQEELSKYKEEKKMPYITSIERSGEERGQLEGKQELVMRQLNRRVGEIQSPLIEEIRKLPVKQLEELAEALLDFSTVANLEEWLSARPKPVEQE